MWPFIKKRKGNRQPFRMKQFLYLDDDILESFVAQKHKGFIESIAIEKIDLESSSKAGGSISIEGTMGVEKPLSPIKTSGKIGYIGGSKTNEEQHSDKSVVTKSQRDNMFKEYYDYLISNGLVTSDINTLEINGYVSLSGTFHFVDFDRIESIQASIEEGDTRFSATVEYRNIVGSIAPLLIRIPYDALMCHQNVVVLLDKKYLRVNKHRLGFILDGSVSVVGKVHKVLSSQDSNKPPILRMLDNIQKDSFLNILHALEVVPDDNVFLVNPIAIYIDDMQLLEATKKQLLDEVTTEKPLGADTGVSV